MSLMGHRMLYIASVGLQLMIADDGDDEDNGPVSQACPTDDVSGVTYTTPSVDRRLQPPLL